MQTLKSYSRKACVYNRVVCNRTVCEVGERMGNEWTADKNPSLAFIVWAARYGFSGRVGKHSELSMVEWWGWESVSERGG